MVLKGVMGVLRFKESKSQKERLPPDFNLSKNVVNHAIYWRNILLVKTLLVETFPLFLCLKKHINHGVIGQIELYKYIPRQMVTYENT